MRKLLFALVLLLSFMGCNNNPTAKQPASDLRFCGRWLPDKTRPVYYDFKPDGSFHDAMFTRAVKGLNLPKPASWQVKGNMLYLTYSFKSRSLFSLFKIPAQFTLRDTVKLITDSTLVLATPSTKKYASRIISVIKMKENGKYTTE